ncbi:uncharacterized protein LOC130052687 [Ostrea edulis]|uniref:uncharacterized protein LOC130052687 n=1 Tax=Ostrea edulis TaxID=37623 RepID=UPI0024AF14A2|nr:uncharacterized protein LOC130052687 [Ostrea edulis]
MMLTICLYVSCVSMALAATTKRPHHHSTHMHHTGTHPTHEPSVSESFFFYYDYHTHTLLVRASRHKCYLYQTSAQEQVDVHSSHGLHTIEKNVIDTIDSNAPMTTVTHDDLVAMSNILGKKCGEMNTIYQIN